MTGKTLAGRYRLEERLCGGEHVSTYLGVDDEYEVEVEVDVLAVPHAGLPVDTARLSEILDAAMKVSGPHVSRLRDWGEEADGGLVYAIREKTGGASLAEILSGTGGLPRQQVIEITAAAVEVLTEAYGRGLFYLGLNPGQVVLDERGGLRFTRVGFGWILEESEPVLAARVSPYRAPETDGGREGSRTSDVYSLAVMVRQMLPEVEGGSRLAALLQMATDPLPKRRPSSPRLLLEELQAVRAGTAEAASPGEEEGPEARTGQGGLAFLRVGSAPSLSPPARHPRGRAFRNLLLVVAGGLALWLAFAAVAGLLSGRAHEEPQAPAGDEEKVTLPDLQGLTAAEAVEILAGLGLEYTTREAPSRLWSAGRVAAQEPAEGSALRPGERVCLIVSTGRGDEAAAASGGGEAPAPDAPSPPGRSVEEAPQAPQLSSAPPPPAANQAPRAVPSVSGSGGPAPLYVTMDGSASYDPDGTIVRYLWHCGDGTVIEGVRAQHVYDPAVIPARFQVVLEVLDDGGMHASSALVLEVY